MQRAERIAPHKVVGKPRFKAGLEFALQKGRNAELRRACQHAVLGFGELLFRQRQAERAEQQRRTQHSARPHHGGAGRGFCAHLCRAEIHGNNGFGLRFFFRLFFGGLFRCQRGFLLFLRGLGGGDINGDNIHT